MVIDWKVEIRWSKDVRMQTDCLFYYTPGFISFEVKCQCLISYESETVQLLQPYNE